MSRLLTIYIERLKNGEITKVEENLTPEDLQLNDDLLIFEPSIILNGSAYLAEDHLVIQLDISAQAKLPCSVCNKDVAIPLDLKNVYITRELSEIRNGLFHFLEDLRETILLEAPSFIECDGGKCPQRNEIKSYLKQEEAEKSDAEIYFPFNDLDEKMKEN